MRRDERRHELPPIGTYPWPNQPSTYSVSDNSLSASYPESSTSLETYEFNYSHGSYGSSTAGYSHEASGSADHAPISSTWADVPLDPNAIYHMPYHTPAWSSSPTSESPYEYDRLVLRQAWEQRVREHWFRRNGINASPVDTQYDRFIPELRAGEYADRYVGRSETQPGCIEEAALVSEPQVAATTTTADYTGLPTSTNYYQPPRINEQLPSNILPSSIIQSTIHDNISTISPSTSAPTPSTFSLYPYREPSAAYSPTDTDSPTSLRPSVQAQTLSASPVNVLSPLDSDAADSPLSDSYHARHVSPAGSPPTSEPVVAEPPSSSVNEADVMAENLAGMRARSVDSASHGHPAMGPIRRGNSAGDRGKNAAGSIRVQRPAGIKWNQRTRCAYINPVTGLQCRTSAGRGPDLERHLRTVHLREEARAVSDGLIPRDKAELLPPDWVMGDRLDFDCPHCAVRFTREDARDRHVKVQHQK